MVAHHFVNHLRQTTDLRGLPGKAHEGVGRGTGIGLAITERAVRLHGGSVSAANAPDGGLVVTIVLPVAAS